MQDFDKKLGSEQNSRVLTSNEQETEQGTSTSGTATTNEQPKVAPQESAVSSQSGTAVQSVHGAQSGTSGLAIGSGVSNLSQAISGTAPVSSGSADSAVSSGSSEFASQEQGRNGLHASPNQQMPSNTQSMLPQQPQQTQYQNNQQQNYQQQNYQPAPAQPYTPNNYANPQGQWQGNPHPQFNQGTQPHNSYPQAQNWQLSNNYPHGQGAHWNAYPNGQPQAQNNQLSNAYGRGNNLQFSSGHSNMQGSGSYQGQGQPMRRNTAQVAMPSSNAGAVYFKRLTDIGLEDTPEARSKFLDLALNSGCMLGMPQSKEAMEQACQSLKARPLSDFLHRIDLRFTRFRYTKLRCNLKFDFSATLDRNIGNIDEQYSINPRFNPQGWLNIFDLDNEPFQDQERLPYKPLTLYNLVNRRAHFPLNEAIYVVPPETDFNVKPETEQYLNYVGSSLTDKRSQEVFFEEHFFIKNAGLTWIYDQEQDRKWLLEEEMSVFGFLFHPTIWSMYEVLYLKGIPSSQWPSLNYMLRQCLLMWADHGLTLRFFPPFEILLDGVYRSLVLSKQFVSKHKDVEFPLDINLDGFKQIFDKFYQLFFSNRMQFHEVLNRYKDVTMLGDKTFDEILTLIRRKSAHEELCLEPLFSKSTKADAKRFEQLNSAVAVDEAFVRAPHVHPNLNDAVLSEHQSYEHDQFNIEYIPFFEDIVEEFQAGMDKHVVNNLNPKSDDHLADSMVAKQATSNQAFNQGQQVGYAPSSQFKPSLSQGVSQCQAQGVMNQGQQTSHAQNFQGQPSLHQGQPAFSPNHGMMSPQRSIPSMHQGGQGQFNQGQFNQGQRPYDQNYQGQGGFNQGYNQGQFNQGMQGNFQGQYQPQAPRYVLNQDLRPNYQSGNGSFNPNYQGGMQQYQPPYNQQYAQNPYNSRAQQMYGQPGYMQSQQGYGMGMRQGQPYPNYGMGNNMPQQGMHMGMGQGNSMRQGMMGNMPSRNMYQGQGMYQGHRLQNNEYLNAYNGGGNFNGNVSGNANYNGPYNNAPYQSGSYGQNMGPQDNYQQPYHGNNQQIQQPMGNMPQQAYGNQQYPNTNQGSYAPAQDNQIATSVHDMHSQSMGGPNTPLAESSNVALSQAQTGPVVATNQVASNTFAQPQRDYKRFAQMGEESTVQSVPSESVAPDSSSQGQSNTNALPDFPPVTEPAHITNRYGTLILSYFEILDVDEEDLYRARYAYDRYTDEQIYAALGNLDLTNAAQVRQTYCQLNTIPTTIENFFRTHEKWICDKVAFTALETVKPQNYTPLEQERFYRTFGFENAMLNIYDYVRKQKIPFEAAPSAKGILTMLVEAMIIHGIDISFLPPFPVLYRNVARAIFEDDNLDYQFKDKYGYYSFSHSRLPFAWAMFQNLEDMILHGVPVKRVTNYADYPVDGPYYGLIRRFFFRLYLRRCWGRQINFNYEYSNGKADITNDYRYYLLCNDFDSSNNTMELVESSFDHYLDQMGYRKYSEFECFENFQFIKRDDCQTTTPAIESLIAELSQSTRHHINQGSQVAPSAQDNSAHNVSLANASASDEMQEHDAYHGYAAYNNDSQHFVPQQQSFVEPAQSAPDSYATPVTPATSATLGAPVVEPSLDSSATSLGLGVQPEAVAPAVALEPVLQAPDVKSEQVPAPMMDAQDFEESFESDPDKIDASAVKDLQPEASKANSVDEEEERRRENFKVEYAIKMGRRIHPEVLKYHHPELEEANNLANRFSRRSRSLNSLYQYNFASLGDDVSLNDVFTEQSGENDVQNALVQLGSFHDDTPENDIPEDIQDDDDDIEDDFDAADADATADAEADSNTEDEEEEAELVDADDSFAESFAEGADIAEVTEVTEVADNIEVVPAQDTVELGEQDVVEDHCPFRLISEEEEAQAEAEEEKERVINVEAEVETIVETKADDVKSTPVLSESGEVLETIEAEKVEVEATMPIVVDDAHSPELTKTGKPRKYRTQTKSIEQSKVIIPMDKKLLEANRFAQSIASFRSKISYPRAKGDYTQIAGAVRGSQMAVRMQEAENKFHVSPDERLEYDLGLQYATSLPDPKLLLTGNFKLMADGKGKAFSLVGDESADVVVSPEELDLLHPAVAFFRSYVSQRLTNETARNAANAAFAIVSGVKNKSEADIAHFIQDEFKLRHIELTEDSTEQTKAVKSKKSKDSVATSQEHEDELGIDELLPLMGKPVQSQSKSQENTIANESDDTTQFEESELLAADDVDYYKRLAQQQNVSEAEVQNCGIAPIAAAMAAATKSESGEEEEDDPSVIMTILGPSDPNKPEEPKEYRRAKVNVFKTFDNFVPSQETSNVIDVAKNISIAPGMGHTPFFIHSGAGLGKTHLIYAMANEIKKRHPNLVVTYIRAEDFIFNYVRSIKYFNDPHHKRRTTIAESALYRDILDSDVVLVDDIQNFSRAAKSRDAFFEVIAKFMENPKHQLVLAADVPPRELVAQGFNQRLTSRFSSGICYELQVPSVGARRTIVSAKSSEIGLKFSETLIDYLADNLNRSIRDIEGAVKSIGAIVLNKGGVSLRGAATLVSSYIPLPKIFRSGSQQENEETVAEKTPKVVEERVTLETVKKVVARAFKFSPAELSGKSRRKEISTARSMAMLLAKELVNKVTLCEIGISFARDHSSVIEAIQRMRHRLASDDDLRHFHDFLVNKILSPEDEKAGLEKVEMANATQDQAEPTELVGQSGQVGQAMQAEQQQAQLEDLEWELRDFPMPETKPLDELEQELNPDVGQGSQATPSQELRTNTEATADTQPEKPKVKAKVTAKGRGRGRPRANQA